MRRLVVGCGYLGERVARVWRDAGDEVYATTRGHRADALARAGLQPIALDVTSMPPWPALPVVDTVVYAVGRDRRVDTSVDGQVNGLRAVLDALPDGTGRVIYVSSTGVYGQEGGEWVDEASPCEPRGDGGMACLSSEGVLSAHVRGRDAIVLRLAGLYGSGRIPRSADVAKGMTIPGSPDAFLNLIHVDDAASAVVAAAAAGAVVPATYNVSDGHPLTRGEYVNHLASWLGVAAPPFEGGTERGKRVCNDLAVRQLGWRVMFSSCREGLDSPGRNGRLGLLPSET